MESIKVFVYGTLMPGEGRWNQLERDVMGITRACVTGELYDLGSFPALCLDGKNVVSGYVVDLPIDMLAILDSLEGYRSCRSAENLYDRRNVFAKTPHGDTFSCYAYTMDKQKIINKYKGSYIASANWRRRYEKLPTPEYTYVVDSYLDKIVITEKVDGLIQNVNRFETVDAAKDFLYGTNLMGKVVFL